MKGKKVRIVRNVVISVVTLCLAFISGFSMYRVGETIKYNNLVKQGNQYMQIGEYDKAIALFKQSLEYKKSDDAQSNIKKAERFKIDKSYHTEGVNLLNEKKYTEALAEFNKIDANSTQFPDLKDKIKLCKTQYISQNIKLANDSASKGNYEEGNIYLDEILKIDPNNEESRKLKDKFAAAIQEQKNAEAEKAEQAKNQANVNSSQNVKSKASTNSSQSKSNNKNANKNKELQSQIDALEKKKQGLSMYSAEYFNFVKQQLKLEKQKIFN
ncbi:tetratricopeptide repeat-containing protein [Clostridium magnum]|uniref:Tetratricopeptide repeat protein n=1 Tax=Clostridium magnum DSM 2767 TaxID=1121326 RepID=A0A161Y3X3_9CLOT|nr:tetratricopeptide repeat-containing protein [Clostridium magnum]KZL92789.1 tetratricopeptide repeat protein [Clostridium magnum DSM 2767]SHJ40466.1 Tetratricopeptide repeat-containing protein [Clostridium magnum DSM 2767]